MFFIRRGVRISTLFVYMNAQDIVALARKLTCTDATQVLDADAVVFLNVVYDDLWTSIARDTGEDFFFHTWYINTLAGENTYALPSESGTQIGLLYSLAVSLQYNANGDYTKLREARISSLAEDLDTYRSLQPTSDPFFVMGDMYVMLFPEPKESVIEGLKLYGMRRHKDLSISSSENAIELPKETHTLLAQGMCAYIWSSRGKTDEARAAQRDYLEAKDRMIRRMAERVLVPAESVMPNLSFLA